MKYTTLIPLLFLLLKFNFSQAGDKKQDQYHHPVYISESGIRHENFQRSITPFYIEDFAGGSAGWQTIDSAGNGVNWHYTTTGAFNAFFDSLSVVGTSAANGYMIYDSDSANQSVGGENADLISSAINCSTHPNVHLTFNEYLIYYNDTATVLVSNDNINWTEFHNSSAGLGQQQGTPNPNIVDLDISSVAANQSNVYIRFNYRADFSFFWMIDDVQLYEAPAIEASVIGIDAPVTSCTLLSASESIVVSVFNSGGDSITGGFDLTYIIDNGTPVTENVTTPIPAGTTWAYGFNTMADLSAPGIHTITAYIDLAGDTISSNDTVKTTIHNGPYVINASTFYGNGFEPSDDLSGFITEDNNGDSTTWEVNTVTPHAGNYSAQISALTADDWFFTTCIDLDSSIVYKIEYFYRTNSSSTEANFQIMIGSGQASNIMTQEIVPFTLVDNIFYLPASEQFTVFTSGTYYVGLHVQNTDSLVGFRIDDLFIGPVTGVGLSTIGEIPFSVFPNPSSGSVYINSNQNSSNGFTIEVLNSFGKLIASKKSDELIKHEINMHEQPSGIYFVRLVSDNQITTQKFSIIH